MAWAAAELRAVLEGVGVRGAGVGSHTIVGYLDGHGTLLQGALNEAEVDIVSPFSDSEGASENDLARPCPKTGRMITICLAQKGPLRNLV